VLRHMIANATNTGTKARGDHHDKILTPRRGSSIDEPSAVAVAVGGTASARPIAMKNTTAAAAPIISATFENGSGSAPVAQMDRVAASEGTTRGQATGDFSGFPAETLITSHGDPILPQSLNSLLRRCHR
jgi:hypothetical protein